MIADPHNPVTKKLAHIESGQKITKAIRQINDGFDATNRLADRMRPSHQVSPTPSGGAGFEYMMIFLALNHNQLTCKRMKADGTINSSLPTVYVLRNWMCRAHASRQGITYTYASANERTADNGVISIAEIITPSYDAAHDPVTGTVGDVIRVQHFPDGIQKPGTSEKYTSFAGGGLLVYLDCNDDARAWAKVAS